MNKQKPIPEKIDKKIQEKIIKELKEGSITYCSPTLHYFMGACPNCTVGIIFEGDK